MRRGTRVGQAYVSVTADGSGINDEIVDSVDEAEPRISQAGDRAGERYGERFSDRFRERLDGMRDRIGDRLRQRLGDAGDDSGREFSDRFGSHFDEGFMDRLAARVGGHFVDALNFAILHGNENGDNPLAQIFERWMDDTVSGNGSGGRGGRGRGGLGDLFGRFFGAGSRNNVLNLLGRSIGGIVNLTERGSQVISGFAQGFSEAAESAGLLQRVMSGFKGAGAASGLPKLFASIGEAGPAAALAILVVVTALSSLVSVASALAALLTAIVSTITSALAGALAIGAAGFVAVAAAAGLAVAAFTSMTDAQQALLTNAFQPLHAEITGIGQLMITQMIPYFQQWSENLQQALLLAAPVAQVMGQAFGEVGNILTRSLSGPGFQMLANQLGVYLPSIVTHLSNALGSFLNGTAALFAALLPYVDRFAAYLQNVTDRFSDWATSTQGQNSIEDFVNRAVVSLLSLWNFIREFSGFVFDVLFSPAAQNAGNTIFDGLADAFEGFRSKISDGSLEKWFSDALEFGAQLWNLMKSLGRTLQALYNSGVLLAIGQSIEGLASAFDMLNVLLGPTVDMLGVSFPLVIQAIVGPLEIATQGVIAMGEAVEWVGGLLNKITPGSPFGNGAEWDSIRNPFGGSGSSFNGGLPFTPQANGTYGQGLGVLKANQNQFTPVDLSALLASGNKALNATSVDKGGYKTKPKYVNPYVEWANSLIKNGPSGSAQVRNALLTVNKNIASAITSATRASDAGSVRTAMANLSSSIRTSAAQTVNTAQSALNSAAQSLANATTKGAAENALKKVRKAQKDLAAAVRNQEKINAAAKKLRGQGVVTSANVTALLAGKKVNATLADYAAARDKVADRLKDANQKLTDALQLRDQYNTQVSDSVKEFGSLITAQAKTIDGVQQALTAGDITDNLSARLDKIRHFQNDLNLLLSMGLSNDAYKQLVDAGVEQGSAYADALVQGGIGSIQQTNQLVSSINAAAGQLGLQASNRMYQAGVDAAKGLVDGLTSLSAQLDSAAAQLGNSIAAAIKRALGIKSPSRVLIDMMDQVGDGAVIGLDNQQVKVGAAATRLAGQIAVSPEVAAYAASQGASPTVDGEGVSGNAGSRYFRDLVVNTPTENPRAVAVETINELVGRLP